jgi:hypothetical protein
MKFIEALEPHRKSGMWGTRPWWEVKDFGLYDECMRTARFPAGWFGV